jgi:phosphatidylglycerophosphate synthase
MKIEKEKGASDFLAYYIHSPLENRIVKLLLKTPVTPNNITLLINIVAYGAAVLFFLGHLLEGSILTFFVGLLDGVDGKLARAKSMCSKVGAMEHPFDLLFEFSWLIALSLFLHHQSKSSLPLLLCICSITLMAFYRACYDRFSMESGKSLDTWGKFDRIFRRIAGRRNLYNIHILVGILVKKPLLSLFTISSHAALTAVIYSFRACYALYNLDKSPKS